MSVYFAWVSTGQLEEDLSETQRLLVQERSARTLQENLFNSHLRKQQEMEEENKRNFSRSNEVKLTWGRHSQQLLQFLVCLV